MNARTNGNQSSKICVMIVEDNGHMRTLLRTLLKTIGIQLIVECPEGAQALAKLGHAKPDFIITDLSMAPMDGLKFTRSVRHLPDLAQCVIPIIMLTGHTELHRIEEARDAGVNEILAKPVTAAALYDRIDRIVNRPRPFVRTDDYSGPCRRRRRDRTYRGPWRRSADPENAETIDIG